MAKFGKRSKEALETCHEDIQLVCNRVISYYDFSVREGARTLKKQQEYFNDGFTTCDGIIKKSNHQVSYEKPLSEAVDITPYPSLYDNSDLDFQRLAKYFFREWQKALFNGDVSHGIEWGGTWKDFIDLPHWEIKKF